VSGLGSYRNDAPGSRTAAQGDPSQGNPLGASDAAGGADGVSDGATHRPSTQILSPLH
jgi:hypothetical protein